jgi:hypothetical protein
VKHRDSIIFAVVLIAVALGFISCASHPVKSSEPSVSVLKSEQESNPYPSHTTATTAIPASSTTEALHHYAGKVVAATTAVSSSGENILSLLLLILALLVLWATIRQLRKNKKPAASPALIAAPRKVITPTGNSIRNGVLITSAGPTHLLYAKHNYHPNIVPVNHKDDIIIAAFYYDQIHKMHFAPNTTIKKVAGWAAYQCQISEDYLEEVYLTIRDYFAPLRETAHVAHFVPRHRKHLELDVKILARMRVR